MTKVSDMFDAFKAAVAGELTGYQQIPDPFLAQETASPILAKGFSIAMGPGNPSARRDATCTFKIDRSVQIQLTRRIENTETEITAYETTVKSIFEDQFLLLKYLGTNVTLGEVVVDVDYVGDNGLVVLPTENNMGRHLDLTTTFLVTYQENLNS